MKKFQSRLTQRGWIVLVALALILAVPGSLSAQKRKPIPSTPVKPPNPDNIIKLSDTTNKIPRRLSKTLVASR